VQEVFPFYYYALNAQAGCSPIPSNPASSLYYIVYTYTQFGSFSFSSLTYRFYFMKSSSRDKRLHHILISSLTTGDAMASYNKQVKPDVKDTGSRGSM